jgi:tetrahydromethanopterin S-methyltransferase subunit E
LQVGISDVNTITVVIGLTVVVVQIFILSIYMIRVYLRKAFEMTLIAEKSAITVTTIFNSLPDAILLISDEGNIKSNKSGANYSMQ